MSLFVFITVLGMLVSYHNPSNAMPCSNKKGMSRTKNVIQCRRGFHVVLLIIKSSK